VTNLALVNIVSVRSADHQVGGCETELVEGGDELADVDDGVVRMLYKICCFCAVAIVRTA